MVRYTGLLLALLLVAMALAGCTQDSVERPDGPGGSDDETESEVAETAYRFADLDPTNVTITESGAAALTDYCFGFGCAAASMTGSDQYQETIDLSDSIPAGVPTYLHVHLQANGGTGLSLNAPYVYWEAMEFVDGAFILEAMVIRFDSSEPIELVMTHHFPGFQFPPQAESEWNLEVTLETLPDRAPGRGAILLPLDSGTTGLNITTVRGPNADLLVWTGDGTFVGRNSTTDGRLDYPIPQNVTDSGAVMFFVRPAATVLQINATGPDPDPGPMRVLPVEWVSTGSPESLEPTGSTSWTFEVDQIPLAIGIGVNFDDATDNANAVIRVTSPRALVLESYVNCMICIGFEHRAQSTPGDINHLPGTYTVDAEATMDTGIEVETFVIRPVR